MPYVVNGSRSNAARRARTAMFLTFVLLPLRGARAAPARSDLDRDYLPNASPGCLSVPNADQPNLDGDKVGDLCDDCPGSRPDIPVEPGINELIVDQFGCSLTQACPCFGPRGRQALWLRRSLYTRCIARAGRRFVRLGLITRAQRRAVLGAARGSTCARIHGRPGDVDGDGILGDGDGSGVVGDAPCKGGATKNCDDNCGTRRNPKQKDQDNDGIGDRCDPDRDGDGIRNLKDNCPFDANPGQDDEDQDGVGDKCDKCEDTPEDADADSRGCD
jgi:hypothetical protein